MLRNEIRARLASPLIDAVASVATEFGYSMRFTWDPEKNRNNALRRGLAFETAIKIFSGAVVERIDDRFDYGEIRVHAIGTVGGLVISVVYTDRGSDERRIISAWRAEPHERRRYWEKILRNED